MAVFQGAGVALVTPFREDKSIDFEMLEILIERQIAGHTDAIIVCGTTGEPATMTEEERLSVIERAVRCVAGRVPVLAGSGGNCTEHAVEFSKKAQRLGIDGLLVVTPYYNKATQNGLYEHYRRIEEQTELPIIMYNVPGRTGCNLLPETAARIAADCRRVTGIKEASGNLSQVAELARVGNGLLDIYSGNDDQIIPVLALGGIGVISVLSNVVPQAVHEITVRWREGDVRSARELQLRYLPLANALFTEVNPIPVKAAMELLGYGSGAVRLPLTPLEEQHRKRLRAAMEAVGCLT